MPEKIIANPRYPVPLIPIWSGGNSAWNWLRKYDPAFMDKYFTPFGLTDREGTKGEQLGLEEGAKVYVVPKRKGMSIEQWGDTAVDTAGEHLPPGYSMDQMLFFLNGLNKKWIGERIEEEVGPRKINGHPARLDVLWHPETGDVVNVWGLSPNYVWEHYRRPEKGYVRKYTGWGKDIIPEYLKEQNVWAFFLHVATPELDHGPNICVVQMPREERHFHDPGSLQDELKNLGDGPGSAAGIHLILQGLEIEGYPDNPILYRNGEPLPYQGLELTDDWEEELGIEPMRKVA